MFSHKLRGTIDRINGYHRELWGELSGNVDSFDAGLRQRLIGQLETRYDLSRDDAERTVDQLPH